jgi:hypothetical protein
VAHICIAIYLGDRDQKDPSSRTAQTTKMGLYLHRNRLVEWLKVKALSSNPSTTKNINK